MSEKELERFLDEERVLTCATIGPNGRPHLMPLWYVRDGRTLYAWTYGKSQKARNLERDPRPRDPPLPGSRLPARRRDDAQKPRVSDGSPPGPAAGAPSSPVLSAPGCPRAACRRPRHARCCRRHSGSSAASCPTSAPPC